MFEDVKTQPNTQPKEPTDMFASVDAGGMNSNPSIIAAPATTSAKNETTGARHTLRIVIIALVVVVILGVIGYVAAQFLFKDPITTPTQLETSNQQPETSNSINEQPAGYVEFNGAVEPSDPIIPNEQVANEQINNPTPVPESITPPINESTPIVDANLDTDTDGLTDAVETTLGTNASLTDTDNDGLLDAEEVNIYLTNPVVGDTDGDTFLDGQEIANGYNPNGPGKLFQ